jgi:hypothetical protein
MITKYFLSCFAFTLLFYQVNAMQTSKSKLPREVKLKKIAEQFKYECDAHCFTLKQEGAKQNGAQTDCYKMCDIFVKTLNQHNDALSDN